MNQESTKQMTSSCGLQVCVLLRLGPIGKVHVTLWLSLQFIFYLMHILHDPSLCRILSKTRNFVWLMKKMRLPQLFGLCPNTRILSKPNFFFWVLSHHTLLALENVYSCY